MPDESKPNGETDDHEQGDIMAGDRRIAREDTALPDWYAPDSQYRPIPIVWFAGAFLLQMVVLFGIFVAFLNSHGLITIVLGGITTGIIGKWTWERGMQAASSVWKGATLAVLGLQYLLVAISALPRA